MTQFLKIEKNGTIKICKISNINELYKKCGFRKNDGFEKITNWEKNINGNNINIELWGRITGKNSLKNNYIFPDSLNKSIYGNCSLIYKQNDTIIDLTEELWNKMHIVGVSEATPIENVLTTELSKINNQNINNQNIQKEKKEKKEKNTDDNDDNDDDDDDDDISISDDDDDDYSNSELQEESYLYSSEEGETVDSLTPSTS